MSKIKLIGTWSSRYYTENNVKKTFLVIKPQAVYFANLGKVLHDLDQKQQKAELEGKENPLQEIEVTLDYHYGKRTIDQNKLLWSINQIEADEMNAGIAGDKSQMVTAEDIYYQDGYDYNPHYTIECRYEELILVRQKYYTRTTRVKAFESLMYEEWIEAGVKKIRLEAVERTSELDKLRMSKRIEMCFNRMAVNGIPITNSGDILKYLSEHRQYMNDNAVILDDDVMNQDEYKALHPICEGCLTKYVGDGSGQLAHIKARGMGGKDESEPEKNYGSNWLHLCHDCHIEKWHRKGITAFLKDFPHLKTKVTRAMKREYDWEALEGQKYSENQGVGEVEKGESIESTLQEAKIDPGASASEIKHVWFHAESGAIFVGTSDEHLRPGIDAELLVDLGECMAGPELRMNIFHAVKHGADKEAAAEIFESLGWKAGEILEDIF